MPMDENIVSWNFTNWVTVVLMVAIGFAILGGLQAWWSSKRTVSLPAMINSRGGNSLAAAA